MDSLAARLWRLMEKATPGEWSVWSSPAGRGMGHAVRGPLGYSLTKMFQYPQGADAKHNQALPNAELIVAMHESLPALLSRLESLEVALADCANSLEADLNARFPPNIRKYPSMQADYDAEMSVVKAARSALEGGK